MTKVYGARLKNRSELMKSSSGGAFTAISDIFLENDDYILCSVYDYCAQELRYEIITSKSRRDEARGSKYFSSYIKSSYKDAIELMKKNPTKKLLFVGMGCQAEGFRLLCEQKKIRDRVFIVDIICTSNPSQKVWKRYADSFKNIEYLTFKDKRNGWNNATALVVDNGEEKIFKSWLNLFYTHHADRPSCAECHFCKFNRNTDLTIADFWRIEKYHPRFYDKNGQSLILCHTKKGEDMIKLISRDMDIIESDENSCFQERLYFPPGKPITRKAFWKDMNKKGINHAIEKYCISTPLHYKILRKIKHILKCKK